MERAFISLSIPAARSVDARCGEIDVEKAVWTVPVSRMKGKRELA